MIGFGVGCFHFGIKKETPFEFKGSEYISKLGEALEDIPNSRNIKISASDAFGNVSGQIEDELPKIDEGKGFFPEVQLGFVEFELHIPFDEQAKLLESMQYIENFTEDFKVTIHYGSRSPIAYVEPLFPSNDISPSNAVITVREFLETNLNSDYIRFECIGPSPFHADFYIKESQHAPDNGFTHALKKKYGYDTIIFNYNPELYAKDKITNLIYTNIRIELDLYYFILQEHSYRIGEWETLTDIMDNLIDLEQLNTFNYLKNAFKRSNLLNNTYINLVKFESRQLTYLNEEQDIYTLIYSVNDGHLKYFIDTAIEENPTFPTEQLNKLIKFFESRRMKNMEIAVMLISGFIGGIAGALFTGLFK